MFDTTLDRKTTYKGVEYKIVEILTSGMLLVVALEDFEEGGFPLTPTIIPGE